jgi:MSHA biogenesis protein MshI
LPNLFTGKSPAPKGVTGVCERSDGIALAHVVQRRDQLPLLAACEFLPVANEADRARLFPETVHRLELERSRSVGVLPIGSYSLLQLEPPEVPEAELREAMRWSLRDLVDFPLDEAVVDLFHIPREAQRHQARSVYVVAARTSEVARRAARLQAARLKVTAIDITELALRNLVVLLPENEQGVAFLHLEAERGLISVFRSGQLFMARSFPLGLAELARLAELKDPGPLADRLDAVVLEIQRSLDFYDSNFIQPPVAGVVVAPSEIEIPQFLPHLQRALGVPVRPLNLGQLLAGPELPTGVQARCLVAVGAALRQDQESA